MSQTPEELKELGRIFTAVGNGAQWQFATLTRPEAWHDPDPGFDLRRAVEQKYHIRLKPWVLPPAPEGREWYRGAEFTEIDLLDGFRPLLSGERVCAGDEAWLDGAWRHTRVMWESNGVPLKHRTKRPLPEPDPYAELKAAHAAGKVIQHRYKSIPGQWFDSEIEPQWLQNMEYRIKPDPVPLGPEDVPPMSVLRSPGWSHGQHVTPSVFSNVVCWIGTAGPICLTYYELMRDGWEIQRPGEDWKPCHKEPS